MDRYMKSRGYDLYNLTSLRRYALRALPSKFIYKSPAQGEYGRLLQADALYVRDLSDPVQRELMSKWGPAKILNAMCLYALNSLPDCAADLALAFERVLKRAKPDAVTPLGAPYRYRYVGEGDGPLIEEFLR